MLSDDKDSTSSLPNMQRGNWRKNHYNRENPPRNQKYEKFKDGNRHYKHQNNSLEYSRNTFHHGRKPYERPPNKGYNHHQNQRYHKIQNKEDIVIPPSSMDIKIQKLMNAVQSQGIIGQLVLISGANDNSTSILQNAVQSTKDVCLNVSLNLSKNKFELLINSEILGETDSSKGKQIAKSELCEKAVEELKKRCFYITRRDNYENVTTGETRKNEEIQPTSSFEGSKAYSMMLKMGWGGKGLGVQEQGEEKTVADKMVKNITKEGLGTKNVISEVDQILQDYIASSKVTTLAFDSSFTKEERAQIHSLAQKYNLKSKSTGKEPERRITISRKMAKWDLVKELLLSDLENDSYKLFIPESFQRFWQTETL